MNDASRRGFLAMAGAGAAAVGVAAVAGSADAATPKGESHKGTEVDSPVVAYVKDAKTGEVAVMHGGREVVVRDHKLVAHITSALA